jgi:hypothetical protein
MGKKILILKNMKKKEESFNIPYEIRILAKIRKELTRCLDNLRIVKRKIHYSFSGSIPDYPIYTVKMTDYGISQQKNVLAIRKKLESNFGKKILIYSGNDVSLRIYVHEMYLEMTKKEIEDSDVKRLKAEKNEAGQYFFKNNLVSFINAKTTIHLNDKVGGYEIISTPGRPEKKWVLLHCFSDHALYEIVKALEKDAYYRNRVSVNEKVIHVSDYDKPHASKDVPLIREFISALQEIAKQTGPEFEMETPLLIISSQDVSKIVLRYITARSLDLFIPKVDTEWSPGKIDNLMMSITVTKNQIKQFLGKE